jgi:hypothetical protein
MDLGPLQERNANAAAEQRKSRVGAAKQMVGGGAQINTDPDKNVIELQIRVHF